MSTAPSTKRPAGTATTRTRRSTPPQMVAHLSPPQRHLLRRLKLTRDASSAEFSDSSRSAPHSICAREPQLCDLVPARLRRHRRWLDIIPLLVHPAARSSDAAVRDRAAPRAPSIVPSTYIVTASGRLPTAGRTGSAKLFAPVRPAIPPAIAAGSSCCPTTFPDFAGPVQCSVGATP